MIVIKESHLDHGLTADQVAWVVETLGHRTGFFIERLELPERLGTCPSVLYGPACGDTPVPESEVFYDVRGGRGYSSRLCRRPPRLQRTVTVIAGPHGGDTVLYTAFGGPLAPKEPGELRARIEAASLTGDDVSKLEAELAESEAFWSEHALGA